MMRARWLALCAMAMTGACWAQDSTIFSAMQDELQRAMASMRIEGQPAPYYIAYQLDEASSRRVNARLGEIVEDSATRTRVLRVDVRVGDYEFDSSRFIGLDRNAGIIGGESMIVTLDDDYDVLRRQIWLMTDGAYKRAVKNFAAKKAVYQNRPAGDSIADFSKAEPVQRVLATTAPAADWPDWTGRARQISGVFLSRPDILTSEINVIEDRGRRYFVNSEGFRFAIPIGLAGVRVVAEVQAASGVMARDVIELYESALADMPSAADLVARTRDLASRMEAVRTAKAGDEYSGPVLFEGRAGAELVGQVLVPALVAVRGPDSDNAALERAAQNLASPFLSRIGSRVMAEDLSVSDTPSLAVFAGRTVPGAYELDDEGVPARDVSLIEKGRLVTLLTGRVPQRNLPQSNGHGRGGSAQGGVVQVSSSSAVPGAKLKADYLALLKAQGKPFGYIVRSVVPPGALVTSGDINDLLSTLNIGGPGGPLVPQVVKVTPDGTEEVVRSMRLGPLTPNLFRDVLAASEERVMLTQRGAATGFAAPGALGGRQVPVSVIAPAFIIDNIELQRLRDVAQKPPVVPSPLVR
jgi:hypothetical protein